VAGKSSSQELFAHPLAYIRHVRNWSYQDLVDTTARRAQQMGVANVAARREKAWRWEHWGVVPDRITQIALATELDISQYQVDALPWPQWLSAYDGTRADLPWSQAATLESLKAAAEGAAMDRRGFLIVAGATLVKMADDWMIYEPQRLISALEGGRVSREVVESIERRLPGLRVLEARLGGGHIRSLADVELRLVVALLSESSYSDELSTRLHTVAAELAHIAGWASFDSGYHAAAQRYWASGLRAAHTANSRAVGANILKSMSLQSFDFAQAGDALALAKSAREGAGPVSGRTSAMFALREARMHASLGDAAACEANLAEAERAMDRNDSESDPAWTSYFDQQEYYAQVASCYLDLGSVRRADELFDAAIQGQDTLKVRDRVTYLIRRATAQLQIGDVDAACHLAAQTMPLLSETDSERNRSRIVELLARLQPWRSEGVVADLYELMKVG
jgi:hypothetical protein